jgi:REP element-mobilizing transposase RayT
MMRGINRQAIFDDDEDCWWFMDILADLPFQHDDEGRLLPIRTCVVYAWCLMTNHFHLLMMEEQTEIVRSAREEGASIRQVMTHTGWSYRRVREAGSESAVKS